MLLNGNHTGGRGGGGDIEDEIGNGVGGKSTCEAVARYAEKARKSKGHSFHGGLLYGIQEAERALFPVAKEPCLQVTRAILQADPEQKIGHKSGGGSDGRCRYGHHRHNKKGGKDKGDHHHHHHHQHHQHHRARRYTIYGQAADDGDNSAAAAASTTLQRNGNAPVSSAPELFRLTLAGSSSASDNDDVAVFTYSREAQRPQGGTKHQYHVVDDHTIQVMLHSANDDDDDGGGGGNGDKGTLVPAAGTWRLLVCTDVLNPVDKPVQQGGNYDFRYAIEHAMASRPIDMSRYYTMRIPVFGHAITAKTLNHQVGVTELHLTVQPVRDRPQVMRLVRSALVLFTKADERWFSAQSQTLAVTPTPDTTFASFFRAPVHVVERVPITADETGSGSNGSAAEEEYRPLAVASSGKKEGIIVLPTPLVTTVNGNNSNNDSIGKKTSFASLLFGEGSRFHSELVAMGANASVFLNEHSASVPGSKGGNNNNNNGTTELYRLGDISSVLSAMALVGHFAETAASANHGGTINLHDPAVTAQLLDVSGAHAIREALEHCYANVGTGRLPTLAELFNHTSGLPAELPLSPEFVKRLADERLSHGSNASGAAEAMLDAQHEYVAQTIGERVTPLFEPGARTSFSPLGYAVLRYCVEGWKYDGPERVVESRLREMGFDHVSFRLEEDMEAAAAVAAAANNNSSVSINDRLGSSGAGSSAVKVAPCCVDLMSMIGNNVTASSVDSVFRERAISLAPQGMYNLSCGLYADMHGLARVFSDALPWYQHGNALMAAAASSSLASAQTKKSAALASRYGYIGQMLQPRATVDKEAGVYTGYSLEHVPINYHGRELRAVVKIGQVRGAHTSVVAMVPALHLSAAFSTNADPVTIAQHYQQEVQATGGSGGGGADWDTQSTLTLAPFVEHLIGYVLDHAPSQCIQHDPVMEHLLSFKPAESERYAELRAYNKRAVTSVFDSDAVIDRVVGTQFVGQTFYSLADHTNNLTAETLTIRKVDVADDLDADADADADAITVKRGLMLEMGVERVRGGQVVPTMQVPLAFDAMAADPNFAHATKPVRGALRMLEPCTGFVGEFLSLGMAYAAPVISFRGQLYADKNFIEQVQQQQQQQQQRHAQAASGKSGADALAALPQRPTLVQSVVGVATSTPASVDGVTKSIGRRHHGSVVAAGAAGLLGGLATALLVPTFYGPRYYHTYPPGWYVHRHRRRHRPRRHPHYY